VTFPLTRLIRVSDHMSKDGENSYTISNAKRQTGYSTHFQTTPSSHPAQSSLFRPRGLICLMTFCHSGFELRERILREYNRVKKATTMYFPLIPSPSPHSSQLTFVLQHKSTLYQHHENLCTRIHLSHFPVHQATHVRTPARRLTTPPRLLTPYRHHPCENLPRRSGTSQL
jgi:hypothetical protein